MVSDPDTGGDRVAFRIARRVGVADLALGWMALVYGIGTLGGGAAVGAGWPFALIGGFAAFLVLFRAGALLRPADHRDVRDVRRGLRLGVLAGLPLALAPAVLLVECIANGWLGVDAFGALAVNLLVLAVPVAVNGIPLLLHGGTYRDAEDPSATFE